MSNFGNILKQEISRLARREIKQQTAALNKAAASYRRDIAALKRQVAVLERVTKAQSRQIKTATPVVAKADTALRFRADGFKTLRKRLGLSAEQTAKLLGVSGQSVYAWETKRSSPRRSQLPAIAALRKMGKRDAAKRLKELT